MSKKHLQVKAFCCEQSAARAAMKATLPEGVDLVEVPCGGFVESQALLVALQAGADGVIVFGCHTDNCEHLVGNIRVQKRVERLSQQLESIGISGTRVRFCPVAAVEEGRFVEELNAFVQEMEELGSMFQEKK